MGPEGTPNFMHFASLVQKAQRNINEVDFTALRTAYTERSAYAPYALPPDLTPLHTEIAARRWPQAALIGAMLLENDMLNMEVHRLMANILREVGAPGLARWHFAFAIGLLRSLLETGNGRSFDAAYKPITLAEEYEAIRALDLIPVRQQMIFEAEKPYDVWAVRTRDGLPAGEIYFEIGPMYTYLMAKAARV